MIFILLAAYNGERYIGKQIDSILGQSYKNFRLVIADDGSTDQTYTLAKEYEKKYPGKVNVYRNEIPTGSAKGNFFSMLSRYINYPKMDYIIFSDQDDVWLPKKLEKMMERMEGLEEQYGKESPLLVHANLCITNENLEIIHQSMAEYLHMDMQKGVNKRPLNLLLVENYMTGSSMLFNKALLERYREPYDCIMHDWWIALIATVLGKVSYVKEPLTLYRQHNANTVGAHDPNSIQELRKRVQNFTITQEQVRKNYELMFLQAQSLYDYYGKEMEINKLRILEEFLKLQKKGRLGKMIGIIRNRFYKSTKLMSLGEMLNM